MYNYEVPKRPNQNGYGLNILTVCAVRNLKSWIPNIGSCTVLGACRQINHILTAIGVTDENFLFSCGSQLGGLATWEHFGEKGYQITVWMLHCIISTAFGIQWILPTHAKRWSLLNDFHRHKHWPQSRHYILSNKTDCGNRNYISWMRFLILLCHENICTARSTRFYFNWSIFMYMYIGFYWHRFIQRHQSWYKFSRPFFKWCQRIFDGYCHRKIIVCVGLRIPSVCSCTRCIYCRTQPLCLVDFWRNRPVTAFANMD